MVLKENIFGNYCLKLGPPFPKPYFAHKTNSKARVTKKMNILYFYIFHNKNIMWSSIYYKLKSI